MSTQMPRTSIRFFRVRCWIAFSRFRSRSSSIISTSVPTVRQGSDEKDFLAICRASRYRWLASCARPWAMAALDRALRPTGAVQASSRYSETWMFSQMPRCAIDSARADRRLPASISRAGISLRRRGT